MSACLFINRNIQKTSYDRITIRKDSGSIHVTYIDDYSPERKGILTTYSITDFYQYVNNMLDILQVDRDIEAFVNMDVMIPGYPVVCMNFRDNNARNLLLSSLYCWILSA